MIGKITSDAKLTGHTAPVLMVRARICTKRSPGENPQCPGQVKLSDRYVLRQRSLGDGQRPGAFHHREVCRAFGL